MGWFSSLWDWVSDKASDVSDWIADKAESIGKFLGLIEDHVAKSSNIDENSSAQQIDRMQETLSKFTSEYAEYADKLEDFSCNLIEYTFKDFDDNFIKELRSRKIISPAVYNFLIMKKGELKSSIKGTLTSKIKARLSFADQHCLDIIKLPSNDADKKLKLHAYCEQVFAEAHQELAERVGSNMEAIIKSLTDAVEQAFEEQDASLQNQITALQKLEEQRRQESFNKEAAKNEQQACADACAKVLELLKSALI